MKRSAAVVVLVLGVAAAPAFAEPTKMSEAQLDQVTGGLLDLNLSPTIVLAPTVSPTVVLAPTVSPTVGADLGGLGLGGLGLGGLLGGLGL
jgi:hypothetical protein